MFPSPFLRFSVYDFKEPVVFISYQSLVLETWCWPRRRPSSRNWHEFGCNLIRKDKAVEQFCILVRSRRTLDPMCGSAWSGRGTPLTLRRTTNIRGSVSQPIWVHACISYYVGRLLAAICTPRRIMGDSLRFMIQYATICWPALYTSQNNWW